MSLAAQVKKNWSNSNDIISNQIKCSKIDEYRLNFGGRTMSSACVRDILVKTEKQAKDTKARLDKGADFGQMAKAFNSNYLS